MGRRLHVVGTLISVGFLVAVGIWIAGADTPELPDSALELALAAIATVLYAVPMWLRAERWRQLLAREGGDPGRVEAWRLTLVGYMGNTVLPARAGDGIRGWLVAPRSGLSLRTVLGTLVSERVLDAVAMLALFAALAYLLLSDVDVPGSDSFSFWPLLAGAVLLIAAALFLRSGRGARIRRWVEPVISSLRNLRGSHLRRIAALTAAIWLGETVIWMTLGHAAGVDPSLPDTLYIVSVTVIFMLVPSGPGAAGTMDAGILFGAIATGGSESAAITYLLMVRVLLLGPLTVAGIYMLLRHYRDLEPPPGAVPKV